MDESERTLGISEVRNTIDRIKYIRNNDTNIKAALDFTDNKEYRQELYEEYHII